MTTAFWVRRDEVGKNWVAGMGAEIMFIGFSSEEAAWTWLRAHLADKYEAVLRSDERRDTLKEHLAQQREMLLAQLLEPKGVRG